MNTEQITPEMERVLAESEAMLLEEEAARARGEDPFADLRLFTPQEHATRSPDQILETTPADCSLQSPAESWTPTRADFLKDNPYRELTREAAEVLIATKTAALRLLEADVRHLSQVMMSFSIVYRDAAGVIRRAE